MKVAITALVVLVCLCLPGRMAAQEDRPSDFRGKMLMEIIDTLERDLERLGRKRRELARRKGNLEQQLATIQERTSTVNRALADSKIQIEKLLRSMALMKQPDDLLLFFSTMQYHDLHVYNRTIRKVTVELSNKLTSMVEEKKELDRRLGEYRREAETLMSRRKTLEVEITSVEHVAHRARSELAERTKKIAAIESLFMTGGFDSPFVDPSPGTNPAFPDGEPEESLATFRGKKQLQIPVSPGRLVKNFEELPEPPYGTEKMVRGWLLVPFTAGKKKGATDTAFVRTPFEGAVVFVGEVPGFGLTIIIDNGHGFHTVYSNLFKIHVIKGDTVERNQTIGTIKSHGSARELPYLYFEIRQKRIAVNPKPWFRLRPISPSEQ